MLRRTSDSEFTKPGDVAFLDKKAITEVAGQKSGLSVSQCFGPEMYCSRYNSDFPQWGTLSSLLRQTLEVTLAWRGGGGSAKS